MDDSILLTRLQHLLRQGTVALAKKIPEPYGSNYYVSTGEFNGFKAASLSFIGGIYGTESTYYREFTRAVHDSYDYCLDSGIAILEAIGEEIRNGWLTSVKQLVTAEVFSDFLEMAEHLLNEGYKDAAAVMIGSVLEEHLRQLCSTYKVDTHTLKGTDKVPKQASLINDDLKKAGAYGPIQVKQVTAWLAIRNSAAHGKYTEYSIEQVTLMYAGIVNFIATIN
jgi:hypothetical protein